MYRSARLLMSEGIVAEKKCANVEELLAYVRTLLELADSKFPDHNPAIRISVCATSRVAIGFGPTGCHASILED